MTNEEYIKDYWKYSRKELKTFKKEYERENKRTQDKINDILIALRITYQDLNKTLPKSLKDKLMRKIEEWKKNKIFKGYFQYRVNRLIARNITYRTYVEIMLYGSYMEELSKIDEIAKGLFTNISTYYGNKGRQELGMPKVNIIPYIATIYINGFLWRDYIEGLYLTHTQQTQTKYIEDLRANKEPNVYSKQWQKSFTKQRNRLVSINNDKYSGGLDGYITSIANYSYTHVSQKNYKVRFISDKCEHVTEMCDYMDNMIFNTIDENKFYRPIGPNAKELRLEEITVQGLVEGINLPPINEHFHWCHSTLTYQIDNLEEQEALREVIRRKS